MIKIGKPIIESFPDRIVLKSWIDDEIEGIHEWLWYAVEPEYREYLCDEVADAFVVPMILPATRSGQDIEVDAPMSEKLLYNLQNSVLYAASNSIPYKLHKQIRLRYCPKIKCQYPIVHDYKGTGVGTGCSLGVDSFMVILQHYLEPDCPLSYRLTHLTFFNVGAMGTEASEAVTESFKNDSIKIRSFAEQIGLPVVLGDSNVHIFYPEQDFNWSHTYRNMGMVLALQKLFGKYLYASGYDLLTFGFDHNDSAQYEPFLLPHLSTESTELISANMTMKRSDKVERISNNTIVQSNLYVCLREQIVNASGDNVKPEYANREYLNCGRCMKCERTLLQLDILGVLSKFSKVFDLSEWRKHKDKYVGYVLAYRRTDYWFQDIYNTMKRHGFKISFKSRIYSILYKPYRIFRGLDK